MNPQRDPSPDFPPGQSPAPASAVAEVWPSPSTAPAPRPFALARWFWCAWKLIVGAVLVQGFLSSLMVVGWCQRAARRAIVKSWWRSAYVGSGSDAGFRDWATARDATRELAGWPNWLLAEPATASRRLRDSRWIGGLWRNLRSGFACLFNTWVFTLPGTLLWSMAWYDGWQNSFAKGYEHAWVGPTLFAIGTILFVVAMLYVPMAQARQASTADWRSFYQFRLVWHLVRRRWLAGFGLALLCAGLSLPALILKTAPGFIPQIVENRIRELERAGKPVPKTLKSPEAMSARERYDWLKNYFLACGFYVFPAVVIVRLAGARVYAGALRDAAQSGTISDDELAESEWKLLSELGLLQARPVPPRPAFVRLMAWLATRTGRATACAATIAVWLGLTLAITVGEFLKFSDFGRGWWNQSLIQLPWCDYTPAAVEQAVKESTPGR